MENVASSNKNTVSNNMHKEKDLANLGNTVCKKPIIPTTFEDVLKM